MEKSLFDSVNVILKDKVQKVDLLQKSIDAFAEIEDLLASR